MDITYPNFVKRKERHSSYFLCNKHVSINFSEKTSVWYTHTIHYRAPHLCHTVDDGSKRCNEIDREIIFFSISDKKY